MAGSAGSRTDVEEHGKLVTAEPRHRVAGPDHGLEPRSQDREHFVADAVPVLVVDLLELVEVDEDHRGTRLVLRADRDRVLELLVEEGAVGEPGERIEQRLPPELLLQLALGGDVEQVALQVERLAVVPEDDDAVVANPDDVPRRVR